MLLLLFILQIFTAVYFQIYILVLLSYCQTDFSKWPYLHVLLGSQFLEEGEGEVAKRVYSLDIR